MRLSRLLRHVASLGVGVFLFAAAATAQTAYPLRVTDALGRSVTLPAPPQRIISVAPSVTEILFALGLDRRIAGVSDADDYPSEKVVRKPRVGGVVLNLEAVLQLHPDLIIGVAGLQRGQLQRLIALGLPVVAVDANTLADLYAQIRFLGMVTGTSAPALRLVEAMQARARTVTGAVSSRRMRRTYAEIWGEPLMTAGGGTFLSDLIRRAGGVNIFDDLHGWPQVSEEAVLRRDPEAIIFTYPQGRVLNRRGWRQIAAMRAGRIATVPSSLVSRPGPRAVEGLERLARIIHPEAFR